MSNIIDERVVEMRFDNKQFESNAHESLSTLEKLKNALNLSDSTKSFENLNKVASKVDFGGLSDAIESVKLKFSALETLAIRTLTNIADDAYAAGKRLVSSLSFDQIEAGWDKYAQKTSSVQTIMAATAKDFEDTGEQMEYVNNQLNKLNWFTDETSYSFLDMVNNIGKFTSNNIPLEQSVTAMQGISTWAAISGANVGEASRAMYNLAQAMAVGSVKLIDWKSIENANMATAEFKQTVIETAVGMGTLIDKGDGVYETLKGHTVSVANFNEALSDAWFSADVLLETLNSYGGATNIIHEVYEATGMLASDILGMVEDYKEGTLDIEKASEKAGISVEELSGYLERLSDETMELGIKSFRAAQEAKTFQEAIDATKDAVSTGWMTTFELIFGNYEEAKELWTDFAEFLYDIFAESGNMRNEILEGWKEAGGRDDLFDGIKAGWEALMSVVEPVKEAWQAIFPPKETEERIEGLVNLTKKFKEFMENLKIGEETSDKLRRTFQGLFAVVDILRNTFKALWKGVSPLFQEIGTASGKVLDLSASFGDFLVGIRDAANEMGVFEEITKRVSDVVTTLIGFIKDFVSTTKVSFAEGGGGLTGVLEVLFDKLADIVRLFFDLASAITGIDFREKRNSIVGVIQQVRNAVVDFTDKTISNVGVAISKIKEYIDAHQELFDKARETITNFGSKAIKVIKDVISKIKEFVNSHWKSPDTSFFSDFVDRIQERFHPLQAIFDFFGKVFGAIVSIVSKAAPIIKTAFSVIGKALSSLGGRIAEAFTGGGLNAVLDLFNTGVLGVILWKIKDFIDSLKDFGDTSFNLLQALEDIKNGVVGTFKAIQEELKSKTLKNIAIAIAILTGSLVVLSLLDSDKLTISLGAVAAMLAELFASMAAFTKFLGEDPSLMKRATSAMVTLCASVLILAFAMKKVADVEPNRLAGAFTAVTLLLGELVGVAIALSKYSGDNDVKTGALSLIGLSLAVVILGQAVKSLGKIDPMQLANGLVAMASILSEMVMFMLAVDQFGEFKPTQALSLIVLAASLLILQKAVKAFGSMDLDALLAGMLSVAGLLTVIAGFMAVLGEIKDVTKTATSLVILSIGLLVLQKAVKAFGEMPLEQLAKGLIALGVALAEMVISLRVLDDSKAGLAAVAFSLIEVSAAMLLLIPTFKVLGSMNWNSIAKAMVGMGVALAEMVGALYLIKKSEVGVNDALPIIAIAAAILILTPALKGLGSMNWSEVAVALVTLAGAFVIIGAAGLLLGPLAPDILAISGAIALLGVAVAAVGIGVLAFAAGLTALAAAGTATAATIVAMLEIIIVGLLNIIRDSADALGGALKTIVLVVCDVIKKCVPEIVDTVMVVIDEVLQSLADHCPGIVTNLLKLLIGVIDALADDAPALVSSIMNLLAQVFASVMDAIRGMDPQLLIDAVMGLGLVAALMYAAAGLSAIAPEALLGLVAIGAAVAELSLLLTAIGALNQIPGLNWLVHEGGDLLQEVGLAIGKFIGGIVGGFASGVSSQFPKIGQDLSDFMTNVQPFIDGAKNIDKGALSGVNALIGTIILLTAANVLDGIASWFTGGHSVVKFGEELAEFGPHFADYYEAVKHVDGRVVEASANAAAALAEMARKLPNQGGIVSWFAGENRLSDFAAELKDFGPAMKEYSDSIKGLDPRAVTASANAALSLAEMASKLPNKGGVVGWFVGDNTLAVFAEELSAFGPAMKEYSDSVKGLNPQVVVASANAASVMAEMASKLPNQGGMVSWFVGDNRLSVFGEELAAFGPYIADYAKSVAGVDGDVIVASANAAQALSSLAKDLPNTGGLVSWFTGDNDIGKFGKNLAKFGGAMTDYYKSVEGINISTLSRVITQVKALVSLAKDITTFDSSKMKTFGENLKKMGNKGIEEFIEAFKGAQPKAKDAVVMFIAYVATTIDQNTNQISKSSQIAGETIVLSLAAGIRNKKPAATSAVVELSSSIISQLGYSLPNSTFQNMGTSMVQSLSGGISSSTPNATSAIRDTGNKVVEQLRSSLNNDTVYSIGKNAMNWVANGINNEQQAPVNAAYAVAHATIRAVQDTANYNTFHGIGANAMGAYGDGIYSKIQSIINTTIKVGQASITAMKNALQIHSPSRVFTGMGENSSLAFAGGLLKWLATVSTASEDVANAAIDPVQAALSRISDLVEDGGDDYNPVITPVIDLTNVEEGAQKVSSMFHGLDLSATYDRALGVSAGVAQSRSKTHSDETATLTEGFKKALDKLASMQSRPIQNTFYIQSNDPEEVADAVSRKIQIDVERRESLWA